MLTTVKKLREKLIFVMFSGRLGMMIKLIPASTNVTEVLTYL
jgi:hypothetical protein